MKKCWGRDTCNVSRPSLVLYNVVQMADKKQKTIVVTGGAGFIGSHLCERLAREGHKVISLDNYFTGSKDNHVEGVEYREGHTKDIEKHISEKPDLIYHLGEYPRVEQSFDDVDRVFDYNIVGTYAVLKFCLKHESKLVYAGSSTKFSDDGLGRHQSPYAWTKASNTDLVVNYGIWFRLSYAVAYFYNVYGPRERSGKYGTVIQIFKEQSETGKPITVSKPGTQKRNFTHVDDIVDGLLTIGEKGGGDEYGLGADETYSVLEIAKMFEGEIKMIPERKGNRMDAPLDISKSSMLGWSAKRKVSDYIADITRSNE
jgi:UDP-glucose 4-epimerase